MVTPSLWVPQSHDPLVYVTAATAAVRAVVAMKHSSLCQTALPPLSRLHPWFDNGKFYHLEVYEITRRILVVGQHDLGGPVRRYLELKTRGRYQLFSVSEYLHSDATNFAIIQLPHSNAKYFSSSVFLVCALLLASGVSRSPRRALAYYLSRRYLWPPTSEHALSPSQRCQLSLVCSDPRRLGVSLVPPEPPVPQSWTLKRIFLSHCDSQGIHERTGGLHALVVQVSNGAVLGELTSSVGPTSITLAPAVGGAAITCTQGDVYFVFTDSTTGAILFGAYTHCDLQLQRALARRTTFTHRVECDDLDRPGDLLAGSGAVLEAVFTLTEEEDARPIAPPPRHTPELLLLHRQVLPIRNE